MAYNDRLARHRFLHLGLWLIAILSNGCATGPRDDFKLRRDIAAMNLVKMSVPEASERLARDRFVCAKDIEPYAGSFMRSAYCERTIPGIGCKDEEHVTLEFRVESGLIERFTTGRKNGCN
jgi:hypothetical protein